MKTGRATDHGSRPLAVIRRSTRCSGRPMSILSDTLTRCYTRATENSHFCPLSFGVKKRARTRARCKAGQSTLRRASSREICLARCLIPCLSTRPLLRSTYPGPIVPYHPRRAARFLIVLRDAREIIWVYALRSLQRSILFPLEGTVSFLILRFPSPPLPPSRKTQARLGPTTREMTSVRGNEALRFLHRVYDANDEF